MYLLHAFKFEFSRHFFQVNLRSLGEAAGLQAGDVIAAVNGQDISLLKHKEAQEAIKLAGNNFVLTILRYELISKYVGMYYVCTLKNGPD